jgi:hypothetical protein
MPLLTLLIPFRNRHSHLLKLLEYFSMFNSSFEVEFIILESAGKATLHDHPWPDQRFRYTFIKQPGIFHKTLLLNTGLSLSKGTLIIPYDVDLLPVGDALNRSVTTAITCDNLLIAGYRLMSSEEELDQLTIAPEDSISALKKYLLNKELFGVCPVFHKKRLLEIGGWDENFKGWGVEDQDIIERYCEKKIVFARSPQITYTHLYQEKQEGWNNHELTIRNREFYAAKKAGKLTDEC